MVRTKKEQYQARHTMMIVVGVALCIMAVIPVITLNAVADSNFFDLLGTVLLFVFVALGVFMIVNTSIINGGYNVLLEEDGYSRERKTGTHSVTSSAVKTGSAVGIFWCIVLAVFFAYSFTTWDFGRSWVIFPIAGVLTPVIVTISNLINKK